MNNNYSQIAYYKILDLEKRLKTLEEQVKNNQYKSLTFDLSTDTKKAVVSKKVTFNCVSDGVIKLNFYIKTSLQTSFNCEISLNDKVIKSETFLSGEGNLEFENFAVKGLNTIVINLSAGFTYSLNVFNVNVSGKVDYANLARRLSIVTLNDANYILYLNDNEFCIYKYTQADGLYDIYHRNRIFDCHLAACVDGVLYILYIDLYYKLYCFRFETGTNFGTISALNFNGATSVCGYANDYGIKIMLSKTNYVYSGDYIFGEDFVCENTNRRGAKVTCDADLKGVYVISDSYKCSKLVKLDATYVIEKGEHHHITMDNDRIRVFYKNSNQVCYQDVDGGVSSPKVYGFCDELLKLYDGKYLMRVKDKIKVV